MNQNYNMPYGINNQPNRPPYNRPRPPYNDNRLIGGGFLGPFILGGITGGLVAPYFYGRPNYYYYPPYPNNYYYYGGYYR